MNDLKENNIIVTGATGGIGNSIIKKLYDAGANILATGTKNEKLEELKKKFENIKAALWRTFHNKFFVRDTITNLSHAK